MQEHRFTDNRFEPRLENTLFKNQKTVFPCAGSQPNASRHANKQKECLLSSTQAMSWAAMLRRVSCAGDRPVCRFGGSGVSRPVRLKRMGVRPRCAGDRTLCRSGSGFCRPVRLTGVRPRCGGDLRRSGAGICRPVRVGGCDTLRQAMVIRVAKTIH